MGKTGEVEYVKLDCIVVGQVAKKAIELLKQDVDAKRKVLVGFRAGDPKPDFYEYKDGKTGEIKPVEGLKARLLQLTYAMVDGRKVDIPLVPKPDPAALTKPYEQAKDDIDMDTQVDVDAGSACEDAHYAVEHAE